MAIKNALFNTKNAEKDLCVVLKYLEIALFEPILQERVVSAFLSGLSFAPYIIINGRALLVFAWCVEGLGESFLAL